MQTKNLPNVLFIMTDQLRADCAGPLAQGFETPALNRIASAGTYFTEAYTNSPQCVSARTALHYGLYPSETGVTSNAAPSFIDYDRDTWIKRFAAAGYHMSVFGKTHLTWTGPRVAINEYRLKRLGFETINETKGPRASTAVGSHMTNLWERLGLLERFREDLKAREDPKLRVGPSPLGLEHYYDTYVAEAAKDFIKKYDEQRPFFCWLSFPGPHEPYDTPEPYASMYGLEQTVPAIPRPETVGGAPGVLQELLASRCPENPGLTEHEIAELRANYMGGVRLIDDKIAEVLDLLDERGMYNDTVILFTSDHGEMNGDWGMLRKKTFLDGSVRIPLIVKNSGAPQAGSRAASSDALAELLDVGPTLLDLAGLNTHDREFGGRSLAPQIMSGEKSSRPFVTSQFMEDKMVASSDWKIAINKDGDLSIVFDKRNDPLEQVNLADDMSLEDLNRCVPFDLEAAFAQHTEDR